MSLGECTDASAQEIIKALEVSSSNYYTKNERIGYGIPNMKFARYYLSSNLTEITVYPNPFPDHLIFFLPDDNTTDVELELRDMYGRIIANETYQAAGTNLDGYLMNTSQRHIFFKSNQRINDAGHSGF